MTTMTQIWGGIYWTGSAWAGVGHHAAIAQRLNAESRPAPSPLPSATGRKWPKEAS